LNDNKWSIDQRIQENATFYVREGFLILVLACRKKRVISKMAGSEEKPLTADVISGDMIFQPILEDGVFRFDSSANDRDAAYPSLSFINTKDRDVPITTHKVPVYTPTFECLSRQQIVNIEVSCCIVFAFR
jgi:hypothetical protein